MTFTKDQWPDNICSGEIRYAKASNYDGFYLADASHGIPTFGSVADSDPVTIRGQHVRIFNYPGQTEAIAAQIVQRWNAHKQMLEALEATRALVSEAAMIGFNCHDGDWAQRLYANQAALSAAIDKANGKERQSLKKFRAD